MSSGGQKAFNDVVTNCLVDRDLKKCILSIPELSAQQVVGIDSVIAKMFPAIHPNPEQTCARINDGLDMLGNGLENANTQEVLDAYARFYSQSLAPALGQICSKTKSPVNPKDLVEKPKQFLENLYMAHLDPTDKFLLKNRKWIAGGGLLIIAILLGLLLRDYWSSGEQ